MGGTSRCSTRTSRGAKLALGYEDLIGGGRTRYSAGPNKDMGASGRGSRDGDDVVGTKAAAGLARAPRTHDTTGTRRRFVILFSARFLSISSENSRLLSLSVPRARPLSLSRCAPPSPPLAHSSRDAILIALGNLLIGGARTKVLKRARAHRAQGVVRLFCN